MKRSFKKGKSLLNKLSNSSLGSTGSSNSLQQAGGTATKEFTSGPSVRPSVPPSVQKGPPLPSVVLARRALCRVIAWRQKS